LDPSAFIPAIGIVLIAVVLLWFTVGTQYNIRKGERMMRWLQDGLPALGPRTTLRWLGSSVAELSIVQPRAPYREATVMIVLEPRDLGAVWALARRRGRRDFLLLRLSLTRAPRFRADVIDPAAWTAGHNRRDEPAFDRAEIWAGVGGSEVPLRAHLDDGTDAVQLRALAERLTGLSSGVWRVSVRPTVPHLEIHLLLPDTARVSSGELLGAVTEAARALSAPR
jgi:hypothetical protein